MEKVSPETCGGLQVVQVRGGAESGQLWFLRIYLLTHPFGPVEEDFKGPPAGGSWEPPRRDIHQDVVRDKVDLRWPSSAGRRLLQRHRV